MQQLSSLDATFLHLESPRTPMHIGAVLTFAAPSDGNMTFHRFISHVQSRLPSSPVFRRRLAKLPLDLDRPYWVEDESFDIHQHIQCAHLHGHNQADQRQVLINGFFSQLLDRERPLWAMHYIEHDDAGPGTFSVLLKVHHAAIDGVSGEKLIAGLLSPELMGGAALPDDWNPEHPSIVGMSAERLRALTRLPGEWAELGRHLGHSVVRSLALRRRDWQQKKPPIFFMAPSSPFNSAIAASRYIDSAHLSMARIKAIRSACPGCTLNDVVLALCAGALRQQLLPLGQLPQEPMVAMVPVSKRQSGECHGGNVVSAMLVTLATQTDSPLARLQQIQQHTLQAKEYNREVALDQLLTRLPRWSTSWFLKAYTYARLALRLKPIFNLIITNVPSSPQPLYLDTAHLLSMEGTAPILDGMGLTLVVTSYQGDLTITATSTAAMAKQLPAFINGLHTSLDELQDAVSPEAQARLG